jgi:hypothetical protein
MADKKTGRGRPKGAPNANRLPKSLDILKMSRQGLEMSLKWYRAVLLNEEGKYTPALQQQAAKQLSEIGKHFLTLEEQGKLKDLEKEIENASKPEGEEKAPEAKEEATPAKTNVHALRPYKG